MLKLKFILIIVLAVSVLQTFEVRAQNSLSEDTLDPNVRAYWLRYKPFILDRVEKLYRCKNEIKLPSRTFFEKNAWKIGASTPLVAVGVSLPPERFVPWTPFEEPDQTMGKILKGIYITTSVGLGYFIDREGNRRFEDLSQVTATEKVTFLEYFDVHLEPTKYDFYEYALSRVYEHEQEAEYADEPVMILVSVLNHMACPGETFKEVRKTFRKYDRKN